MTNITIEELNEIELRIKTACMDGTDRASSFSIKYETENKPQLSSAWRDRLKDNQKARSTDLPRLSSAYRELLERYEALTKGFAQSIEARTYTEKL